MRRPSTDLSEPARNLEESLGAPQSDPFASEDDMSLPPFDDAFPQALDLDGIDDPPRIYTPPPHLAARFYRPSQTRRKGSAASSRRNSISSLHSLTSSSANGPQSKHVANHQRRDAILKDRQKRLADRAAHVEKVRIRAAIAKERTIALSEERAQAAALTRERNLKEIAAACAEEVKRAKAIAETTKGKRELELQKMRQHMEERQAEAERRREELRKQAPRARGSSLGAKKSDDPLPSVTEVKESEARPLTDEAAVCMLQTWWRSLSRSRAVDEFSQLGLTVDGVGETPYDQVTEMLQQQRVILATARVLAICGLRKGPSESVNQMKAVKFFLSAFLILGHPTQVLSNVYTPGADLGSSSQLLARDDLENPLVQELVSKAKDLLITFETTMSRLTRHNNYTVPPALRESLPDAYSSFESAFLNWQSRDKHALIDSMLKQLVELDAIIETIKSASEPAVVEEYKRSAGPNQEMLIVRIKRLLGKEEGSKAIRHAVLHARKARAEKKKERKQMIPRIVELSISPESAMADLSTGDQSKQKTAQTPASTPAGAYPSPPATPSSRPSQQMSSTRGKLLPDNRIVVHELAINKEYKVRAADFLEAETKALRPYLAQMRATMHEDAVSREIHFHLLIKVAEHIREKLLRLVKPPHPLCDHITDLLDVGQFKQRLENGSFSYENFFAAMGTILPQMCAQFRDAELADLIENKLSQGNYVDRMESLVLFIDCMMGDHANYLLSKVAPLLLESATEYETKSFAAAIDQQKHGLFAAQTAWRAAKNKVMAEVSRRDPENVDHPKNRPTAEKIYAHMLVGIFTQPCEMRYGQIPEMLHLDYKRILKYGTLTRNMVTTCGILLQCKNLLKRDVRAPWKTEAQRIETVLNTAESEEAAVNGVMAALEAGRSMPPAMKTHLREFVQKLITAHLALANTIQSDPHGQWEPTAHDPTQPVLKLLLRRLRDHITARMAAASSSEKHKMANAAGEKLASSGLGEFVDRVRDMVEEMGKVGAVDRDAHGIWWEEVAASVQAEAASTTIASA
ncbi:unnamed protein product [Discula destructiva]